MIAIPSHSALSWRIFALLMLPLATMPAHAVDLDAAAGWVLDAPPLQAGKPLPTQTWKPGLAVTPAVLTQLEARLPATDRLPLKVLWWEHQGLLTKTEPLLKTVGKDAQSPYAAWLALTRVEATLVQGTKPDEAQTKWIIGELDRIGPSAAPIELAACYAAKGHLCLCQEKWSEMAQSAAFAKQALAAAVAADTSGLVKRSWQYRQVRHRLAQLHRPVGALSPLAQAARWVLDSPPLTANTQSNATAWKPGQPMPPATLAQLGQSLLSADRLPLTALWWEHQGQLAHMASQLKPRDNQPDTPHTVWLSAAWAEAVLSQPEPSEKEVAQVAAALDKILPQTKGLDQVACLAAQAHAQAVAEEYVQAKQTLQSAGQYLAQSKALKTDWRHRVLAARITRLNKEVVEALIPAADKYFAEGQAAYKRKEWLVAAKKFHAVFTRWGESAHAAEAGYLTATSLLAAQMPNKAAEELQKWFDAKRAVPLKKDALWARSWLLLGEIQSERLCQAESAKKSYGRMIEETAKEKELAPTMKGLLAEAYFRFGSVAWLLAPQGKPCPEAADAFVMSVRLNPDSPLTQAKLPNQIASLARMAREGRSPVLRPTKVMRGDPKVQALLFTASCQLEAQQLPQARALLEQFQDNPEIAKLATSDQVAYAWTERAESYRMEGDMKTADGMLAKFEEKGAVHSVFAPMVMLSRANMCFASGKTKEGRDFCAKVAKQWPRSEEASKALYALGWSYYFAKEWVPALRVFQQLAWEYATTWEGKYAKENLLSYLQEQVREK